MKKFMSIVLCLVFVFALSSCGCSKEQETAVPQVTDPASTTKAHSEVKREPLKEPFEGTVEEVSVECFLFLSTQGGMRDLSSLPTEIEPPPPAVQVESQPLDNQESPGVISFHIFYFFPQF